MNKRMVAIALTAAGLATAGFGSSVLVSAADIVVDGPTVSVPGVPPVTVPDVTVPLPAPAPAPQQTEPQPPPEQQPAPAPGQAEPAADTSTHATTTPQGGEPKVRGKGATQKTTGDKPRTAAQDAVDGAAGDVAKARKDKRVRDAQRGTALREPDGLPALSNPGLSIADPGPAPIGVPNFFIDKFRIPPFLLSIYQAAGVEYGIRWEVLAAINEIETDYGRNLNVSSAGAVGWMQFMPATWKQYGVDANGDRRKDPFNPVDAIFGAARYLKAAGGDKDLRRAIFAYNHADWYVDSVLMRARLIGGLPTDLVGSLTGLTQGMFPVAAKARYADDLSERDATRRVAKGHNAAVPVEGAAQRRGIDVFARPGSPVIAVQDGRIVKLGHSARLGKFVKLRDAYGNTYTYANLKRVADRYAEPKPRKVSSADVRKELKLPARDPRPTRAASAGAQVSPARKPAETKERLGAVAPRRPLLRKERLFAAPQRPAALRAGGRDQLMDSGVVTGKTKLSRYIVGHFGLQAKDVRLRRLKVGAKVIGGTILGRVGRVSPAGASHMLFEIRPAGRGAPRIDPKPILDGWKLLESTAIYRAKGKNPFFGSDARTPTIGQILLMGKAELTARVLHNPRIEVYDCGRRDIEGSRIDRRVLATLEFLASSGLRPTVTSLECGHGRLTSAGNVSEHTTGTAVDIAKINGVPILGHQGKGSITDIAVRRLLTLQGTMKPHQIITLMTYPDTDNTLALPDHDDHIHVGFRPMFDPGSPSGREVAAALKPGQWIKLIDRLGEIDNPTVPVKPSRYAVKVEPARASQAHRGD